VYFDKKLYSIGPELFQPFIKIQPFISLLSKKLFQPFINIAKEQI